MERSRRSVLKSIGTGSGAVCLIGGKASAEVNNGTISGRAPRLPDLQVESLDQNTAKRSYEQAVSSPSGERIVDFLRSNAHTIDASGVSGKKVSIDDGYDHTMIDVPVEPERAPGRTTTLVFRIFEEGVTAHTVVDGKGYGTIPSVNGAPDSVSTGTNSIVPVTDLHDQVHDTGEIGPEWSISCLASGTFDAGGPACTFLQGVAAVLASVLLIVPEPGSTAVGSAALAGLLAGSCTIGQAIEEATGCDSVTEIGICVGIPTPWDPAPVKAYPADGLGC